MSERIGSGAEAIIERREDGIVKIRPKKEYRHPDLDKNLRTMRTKAEAKILAKALAAGIPVPKVTVVDDHTLQMDEIEGVQVRDILNEKPDLGERIGTYIAKLHDINIIHADLTTSNMLYGASNDVVTLIDFGLSFHSARIEDKAVDLHLFRQSLTSKHHAVATTVWKQFVKGYRHSENAEEVLERLKKVEARGRNKGGS